MKRKFELELLDGNDQVVDSLIEALSAAGIENLELDDMVNNIADHLGAKEANDSGSARNQGEVISLWSQAASDVNNQGMESQVRVLLAFHGIDNVKVLFSETFKDVGFKLEPERSEYVQ